MWTSEKMNGWGAHLEVNYPVDSYLESTTLAGSWKLEEATWWRITSYYLWLKRIAFNLNVTGFTKMHGGESNLGNHTLRNHVLWLIQIGLQVSSRLFCLFLLPQRWTLLIQKPVPCPVPKVNWVLVEQRPSAVWDNGGNCTMGNTLHSKRTAGVSCALKLSACYNISIALKRCCGCSES